eukprot:m51a1_g13648 hypothetical protein (488) ;mRNA; r:63-1719
MLLPDERPRAYDRAAAACRAGAAETVVSALARNLASARVAEPAATALELLAVSPEPCARAVSAGALEVLAQAVAQHPDSESIAECACWALAAGAVELAVSASTSHVDVAQTQEAALSALVSLCSLVDACDRAVLAGAVDCAVRAAETHRAAAAVVEPACAALCLFYAATGRKEPVENRKASAQSRAIAALVRVFSASPATRDSTTRALRAVSDSATGPELAPLGTITDELLAIVRQPATSDLPLNACATLRNSLRLAQNRRSASRIAEGVALAMSASIASVGVQMAACDVINLAAMDERNAAAVGSDAVVDPLICAMEVHETDPVFLAGACITLQSIARCVRLSSSAAASAALRSIAKRAPEAIRAAANTHKGNALLQNVACAAISAIEAKQDAAASATAAVAHSPRATRPDVDSLDDGMASESVGSDNAASPLSFAPLGTEQHHREQRTKKLSPLIVATTYKDPTELVPQSWLESGHAFVVLPAAS